MWAKGLRRSTLQGPANTKCEGAWSVQPHHVLARVVPQGLRVTATDHRSQKIILVQGNGGSVKYCNSQTLWCGRQRSLSAISNGGIYRRSRFILLMLEGVRVSAFPEEPRVRSLTAGRTRLRGCSPRPSPKTIVTRGLLMDERFSARNEIFG